MKNKITKLGCVALTAFFLSCGSDDSGPSFDLTNENLAGNYVLESFESSDVTDVNIAGRDLLETSIVAEGSTFEVEAMFNDDGTFTLSGEFLLSTTESFFGSTDSEIVDLDGGSGTYILDDDKDEITLDFDDIDDLGIDIDGTYEIEKFSDTALEILKEVESENENTASGITTITTTTSTITISFSKEDSEK